MVNYKLHYFNGRGRAEISRLIFAAAGVNYEDVRIDDWPKAKYDTPIGQVPYLEIDNTKLPQSLSIARYLAREYNLVGKNNLEAAKADAIVDTCIDLMTAFYYKVHLVSNLQAKGLKNIEKLVKMYGSGGHAVGSSLTWADLFIHEITYSLSNYDANLLSSFGTLKKIVDTVEKNENIAKYLKARALTPF